MDKKLYKIVVTGRANIVEASYHMRYLANAFLQTGNVHASQVIEGYADVVDKQSENMLKAIQDHIGVYVKGDMDEFNNMMRNIGGTDE